MNNGVTRKDIATKYSLPISTVTHIYKHREEYARKLENNSNLAFKTKAMPIPKLDKPVLKFIKILRQNNRSVNGLKIRNFARKYAVKLGMNEFKASDGWLNKFKKRNSISFKSNDGDDDEICKNNETDADSLNAEDNFEHVTDDVNSIGDDGEHDDIESGIPTELNDQTDGEPDRTKRKFTTLKDKLEMINRLKSGAKRKEIIKEYGIKQQTLTGIFKNRGRYANFLANNSDLALKTNARESPKLDEPLLKFIKHRRKKNLPLNGFILRKYAKIYATRLGMHEFKASNGWLNKFQHRHSISLRIKSEDKCEETVEEDEKLQGIIAGDYFEQIDEPNTTNNSVNINKLCGSPSTNSDITEEIFDIDEEG